MEDVFNYFGNYFVFDFVVIINVIVDDFDDEIESFLGDFKEYGFLINVFCCYDDNDNQGFEDFCDDDSNFSGLRNDVNLRGLEEEKELFVYVCV